MKKYNCLRQMLIGLALLLPFTINAQEPVSCTDRDCLIQLADAYIEALYAHDPSQIPFSKDAQFVENIHSMAVGEGLWQSASATPTNFKIYVPDPIASEIAYMGLMSVDGKPELVALRLKIVGGKVSEVEHLITTRLRESSLINLESVRPGLLSTIPQNERMSREELVQIAYSYYDALDENDSSLSPIADDCSRHQNGAITSNNGVPDHKAEESPNYQAMTCAKQFDTGMYAYISTIDNRRVLAVDPQTGLAFGLSHFHHNMENKIIPIRGVRGIKEREVNYKAFDLPAAHVFKISGGEIHEVEAMGFLAPLNSPTGWHNK